VIGTMLVERDRERRRRRRGAREALAGAVIPPDPDDARDLESDTSPGEAGTYEDGLEPEEPE